MLTNDERAALRALARMKVVNGSAFEPDVVLALLDALDAETARADAAEAQVAAALALCDATDVKAAQVSGHALDKVTAKVSTRVVRATISAIDGAEVERLRSQKSIEGCEEPS